MSKGVKSKQGERASGFAKEIFGMGILLFSVLSLLCLITGDVIFYTIGRYVRGFYLGLFGYFSFVVIAFLSLFGLRLLLDRSVLSKRAKRVFRLALLFVFCVFAIIQTAVAYDNAIDFSGNFDRAYGGCTHDFSTATLLGAVSYLIIYPIGAVLSKVGCYIVFSVIIALTILLAFKNRIGNAVSNRAYLAKQPKVKKEKQKSSANRTKETITTNVKVDDLKDSDKQNDDFENFSQVRRPSFFAPSGDFGMKSKRDYNRPSREIDFMGGNFGVRNSSAKTNVSDYSYGEQYKREISDGDYRNYRKDLSPAANYIMTPPKVKPEDIGQPPIKAENPSNVRDVNRGTAPDYDNNALRGSTYSLRGTPMRTRPQGITDSPATSDVRRQRGGFFDDVRGTENNRPDAERNAFTSGRGLERRSDDRSDAYRPNSYQKDIEQRLNVDRGKNVPSKDDDLNRAVNEMVTNTSEEPSLPNISKTYNPATRSNGVETKSTFTDGDSRTSRNSNDTSGLNGEFENPLKPTSVPRRDELNDSDYSDYNDYQDRGRLNERVANGDEPTPRRTVERDTFSSRRTEVSPSDESNKSEAFDRTARIGADRTSEKDRQDVRGREKFDLKTNERSLGTQTEDFPSQTANQLTNMPEEGDPNEGYKSIEDMPRNYRYVKPTYDLLDLVEVDEEKVVAERERLQELAKLVETNFYKRGVTVKLESIVYGMSITRFEYSIPTETSVKSITSNQGDIAIWLHAKGEIRIIAPIPGTSKIGIEVPNLVRTTVGLRELIASPQFRRLKNDGIYIPAGKNVMAEPVFLNLTDMPHLLIAGATGTGKSVFLNAMLVSLLYTYSPEDMRLVIVDPKQLEFVGFEGIPHLMFNKIITQAEEAAALLNYLVKEMDARYALFAKARVKKISAYNESIDRRTTKKLPYIIVLIDEFADLMMKNPVAKKDMDASIQRLAQLARAAGISLVFATQRPTTDVIDGTIKNNFPARICFKTADYTNSQVVIGENGAEKLLGRGDLLYKVNGPTERAQGALVKDEEIERVVKFVNQRNECYYDKKLLEYIDKMAKTYGQTQSAERDGQMSMDLDATSSNPADMPADYHRAVRLVIVLQTTSKSMLQTKLGIGYNKAARIIDWMESQGYITCPLDNKQREIRIDRQGYEQAFGEPFDEDFRK